MFEVSKGKHKDKPRRIKQTEVQTVIMSKERFPTMASATKWIRDHNFKTRHKGKGPDETSTSFRFRQRDPGDFQSGSFRTIRLTDGVSAVIGVPKRQRQAKTEAELVLELIGMLTDDVSIVRAEN